LSGVCEAQFAAGVSTMHGCEKWREDRASGGTGTHGTPIGTRSAQRTTEHTESCLMVYVIHAINR
jgi:hypothetical protein